MSMSPSRRRWLQGAGVLGGAVVAWPLLDHLANMQQSAEMALAPTLVGSSAMAAQGGDYKALVCVYLSGGNDAFNTVTYDINHRTDHGRPRDRYLQARPSVALGDDELLPLDATGARAGMAFHASLKRLHGLYGQGRVAVLANVGPLLEPTTNQTLAQVALPPKLYSHNDQTATWQTGSLEGRQSGWGAGFVARRERSASPSPFGVISMDQASPLTAMLDGSALAFGASSSEGALKPGGVFPGQSLLDEGWLSGGEAMLWSVLQGAVGGAQQPSLLAQDYLARTSKALSSWQSLVGQRALQALGGPSGALPMPQNNALARQLAMVARFVQSRASLGVRRQVFFVQLGGFDTHAAQKPRHGVLLAQLDEALAYFDQLLGADRDLVTTFTASDFGRNLHQNSSGTDHGWGAHHFVMGGAQVKGGHCYGRFPDISRYSAPGGLLSRAQASYDEPQMLPSGAMIPEVSVDQFAHRLGLWFGVPAEALRTILPRQASTPSTLDLGFMAA